MLWLAADQAPVVVMAVADNPDPAAQGARVIGMGCDLKYAERLVYSLVNEGAQILDEGIAQRAGDIDVIYIYGYGFPAHRGGPMGYADEMGLGNVVAALEKYGQTPAPLLKRLAEEGGSFAGWDKAKASA